MGKHSPGGHLRVAHLALEVAARTGMPLRDAEAAVDSVFEVMAESLRSNLAVRLPQIGLLKTCLHYDVRWFNVDRSWAGKAPAKRVEFRANRHFFREKRHRHTDLQPAASPTGNPAGS